MRGAWACSLTCSSSALASHACRELQRALGFTRAPSRFIDRVFALFDSNHDGKLTFGEFLLGITLLSNAPPKDRMRCEALRA